MTIKVADNLFKTTDLYFAAYLRVSQLKMHMPEKEDRRTVFVFEYRDAAELKKLQAEYFNRSGKVGALDYADTVKSLKSLVHL